MSDLILPTRYEEREYQDQGTAFLKAIKRGMLTDDPGLGKTKQAIRATELPAMIVCPAYLREQWAESIKREHPDAVIAHAEGTRKQRDKILNKAADWYIVNYQMVPTYDMPTGINTYINDESHHLRNRRATFSRAVDAMENTDPKSRIYHLSATPYWKAVDDIWMQAHILYPQVFTSYRDFVKLYCNSIPSPWGPKVRGFKPKMKKDLRQLLGIFMMGRTYKDVGRFLPDVIETPVKIKMPPMQRALYATLLKEYSLKWFGGEDEQKKMLFQPTTVLHALRQVTANSGKFEAILGILEDNNNKPAVIGFWYKDHAKKMADLLGDKAVLVTGDLEATERQKLALWAQRNGKHIVASQQSLAEGINLYQYRIFIWGEEHYVPGSNHQFMSRVVRDRNDGGLDREPVLAYYVQVISSIDVQIHGTARSRKNANQATRDLLEKTFMEAA